MNQTVGTFRALFENQLQIPRNPICETCDATFKHPLLPWLVGDRFHLTKERIVFVGKPHRGEPGRRLPSGILDPTSEHNGTREFWPYPRWAYWRYTKEIAERLYDGRAFDSIAMTNLIKCTNTRGTDETTRTMALKCVLELGVIWKELQILKPFTVIFYTYNLYGQYPLELSHIPVALEGTIEEITPTTHKVSCGKKKLGWWERACRTSWAEQVRVLVVGHPERMKREEYINRLVTWIRGCDDI